MSCKCEKAPCPYTPYPPRILATFLQPHSGKGMSWAHICWQSWGLEHPKLGTPWTRVRGLSRAGKVIDPSSPA